jgi:hypothetical protein
MTKTEIEDYFNSNKKPKPTYPHSIVTDRDDTRGMREVVAAPQPAPVPVWAAPAEDYYDFSKRPPATYGSSVVVGRDDTRGMGEQVAAPQGVVPPTWVNPNSVKAPDMYSQAVALDGREPAAIPMEYTAPMNADQRVLDQLKAFNGGVTPAIDPTVRVPDQIVNGTYPNAFAPTVDYPMGPTIEITRGASQDPDPTTGLAGHIPQGEPANGFIPIPAPQGNILRDSSGAPVMSGGSVVGLPNQGPGADPGGKGGALMKQVQTQAPGRGSESGGK